MNLPINTSNVDNLKKKNFITKFFLSILLVLILTVFLVLNGYYDKYAGVFSIKIPFPKEKYSFNEGDLVCVTYEEYKSIIKSSVDSNPSAFGNLVSGNATSGMDVSKIGDFLKFKERISSGISDNLWSWGNDFAYAQVYDLNKETSVASLDFSMPGDSRFNNGLEHSVVKVLCLDESTATISGEKLEVVKIGVSIFESVTPKESFIFFKCSNEKCEETGKECVIVKNNNE